MQIHNQIFYHVHALGKKCDLLWHEGSQFDVGNDLNYFHEYYETSKIGINFFERLNYPDIDVDFAPGETIPILKAYMVLSKLQPTLQQEASKTWLEQSRKALIEMCQYKREVIFEEVRISKFSDRPSRKTCIWLTDEKNIQNWLQRTHAGTKEVYKLSVSGNIHVADEKYLIADTLSNKEFRFNAEKYWSGKDIKHIELKEILFEGRVNILEKVY